MGCDCHLHMEIKTKGHDRWLHWGQVSPTRSYAMFAKMANVRNFGEDIEPIADPRGLPKDITLETQIDAGLWGRDAHSHSYLDAEEIGELVKFYDECAGKRFGFEYDFLERQYLFGNPWTCWKKYPEDNRAGVTAVRFVFWFDN